MILLRALIGRQPGFNILMVSSSFRCFRAVEQPLQTTEGWSLQINSTFWCLLTWWASSTWQRFYGETWLHVLACRNRCPLIATRWRPRSAAQMQRREHLCLTQDFTSFILRPSYFSGELRSGQLLWSFSDDGSIARIRLFSQPVIFAAT